MFTNCSKGYSQSNRLVSTQSIAVFQNPNTQQTFKCRYFQGCRSSARSTHSMPRGALVLPDVPAVGVLV